MGRNLRTRPKRSVFLAAIAVYAAGVASFALAYSLGDLLRSQAYGPGFGSSLYFSLVNQATVGFGDILPSPGLGRLVAGTQIGFGVIWSAFVPALVVYRLLLPNESDVTVGRFLVFDPVQRRFIVRLANRGSSTASGVMVRAWLRRPDPSDPDGRDHVTVGISHKIEASTRFPLLPANDPFYFRFDEADPRDGHSSDDVLGLHPSHLVAASDLLLQVEMRVALGVLAVERVFDRQSIACSTLIPVQSGRSAPQT